MWYYLHTQKHNYTIQKYRWLYVHSYECVVYHLLATTVMFSETLYSVNEDGRPAQVVLVLGGLSATATTVVQVLNTDGSATGEYCTCSILINY